MPADAACIHADRFKSEAFNQAGLDKFHAEVLQINEPGPSLMFGERRKHQRFSINRIAKFYGESGSLPRDCTITDISESGARLFTSGDEIPDHFVLLITGDKSVREECRVAWRLGGEVGVEFVTRERERRRAELVDRLRAEAKQKLLSAT